MYIDDYVIVNVMQQRNLAVASGSDVVCASRAVRAYKNNILQISEEKCFGCFRGALSGSQIAGDKSFTAWGTHVCSDSGKVGSPILKRYQLLLLISRLLHERRSELSLVRRLVGLFTHPLMHAKVFMSVFAEVYKWIRNV